MGVFTLAKKTKKKGKTLTLTDFLAEDSGGSNPAPSYPTKATSWADETDDLEGDGESALYYTIFYEISIFIHPINGNMCFSLLG